MIFGATLEQWAEFFKMAVAAAVAIATVVGPIVYPIYRKWSEKLATDAAYQNISIEQGNRYNETRGAASVTQAQPPSSTGDRGIDAAMSKLLPPVPTPPQAPLIDVLTIAREVARIQAEASAAAAAGNRLPPVDEPAVGPA